MSHQQNAGFLERLGRHRRAYQPLLGVHGQGLMPVIATVVRQQVEETRELDVLFQHRQAATGVPSSVALTNPPASERNRVAITAAVATTRSSHRRWPVA